MRPIDAAFQSTCEMKTFHMAVYALTIFLSAFLLFLVQPLIGKHILPWFGGGAGVWTACMLFFQIVLLVGYSYAHWLCERFQRRQQAMIHLGVIAASLLFASISPGSNWKPTGTEHPTAAILLLLAVHVGVPFLILSSTGPLLQRWFSNSYPEKSPYRLYALSNVGSLLALVSYPFLVEPTLALRVQTWTWTGGYGLFVLVCGYCTWRFGDFRKQLSTQPVKNQSKIEDPSPAERPSFRNLLFWIALAATGSVMLLATTNQICQDLAVVPLLWVLPLAIYLISFILCFDHSWWYNRKVFLPLLVVLVVAVTLLALFERRIDAMLEQYLDLNINAWFLIAVYVSTFFVCCMACHGELARSKPVARYLTRFYLAVAFGGAVGGFLVAVAAPMLFNDYWEFPLGLIATCVLAMVAVLRAPTASWPAWPKRIAWAAACIVLVAIVAGQGLEILANQRKAIHTSRSFFGVTRISNRDSRYGAVRQMVNGSILHGTQYRAAELQHTPTTYYGYSSGIGITIARLRDPLPRKSKSLRIGVVGLGTGTISAHTRQGDTLRFYEIDAEVEELAREYFTYLENSPAYVKVVLGDARIVMEREIEADDSQQFDVLVIDAFSSDAIPLHLITREALQVYDKQLAENGVILFHVSNKYVNLEPAVRGIAQAENYDTARITSSGATWMDLSKARWIAVTRNKAFLNDRGIQVATTDWNSNEPPLQLWTDDYASVWSAVGLPTADGKWSRAPRGGHFVSDVARLLTYSDGIRIQELSQALYHDTEGVCSLVVASVNSMDDSSIKANDFTDFASQYYDKFGLNDTQSDTNALILFSKENGKGTIRMGLAWPIEVQKEAETIFNTIIKPLVLKGRASAGILEAAEALDRLMRDAVKKES